MRKFLKVVLVALVLAVLGVLAWGGNLYLKDKQQVNTVANNKTENNASVNENRVEEKYERVEVKEDPVEIKTEQENETQEQVPEENEVEEASISSEDKAIELAKKEYGTTDGVYFRIDQIQSANVYVVSVRDENTTAALMWYTVDVKNETVK